MVYSGSEKLMLSLFVQPDNPEILDDLIESSVDRTEIRIPVFFLN